MKLEGDKIVVESRYEIDDIQEMIDCYKVYGKPQRITSDQLRKLRDDLDVLYMSW